MIEPEVKSILKEFVITDAWERIKGIIEIKIGASSSWMVDVEGNFIYKKIKDKEFCKRVKQSQNGEKRCYRSFFFSLSQSRKNQLPTVTICEAGFLQFACPILIDKQVICIIGGCQIVNIDLDSSSYSAFVHDLNIDPETFLSAIHKDRQPCSIDILGIEAELITLLAQSTVELIFKKSQLVERDEEIRGISESYQLFGSSRESILNLGDEKFYSLIVNMVSKAMGAEICSLVMRKDTKDPAFEFNLKAAVGLESSIVAKTKIKIGEGIIGYVLQTGQPLLVEDIEKDTRFNRTYKSSRYYTKSLLVAPLKNQEQVIGAISINNKATHGSFNQQDLELFIQICHHVNLALENIIPYPSEGKRIKTAEIEKLTLEANQLEFLCNARRKEMQVLETKLKELEERRQEEETKANEYALQIQALEEAAPLAIDHQNIIASEHQIEEYAMQIEAIKKEAEISVEMLVNLKAELQEAKAKAEKSENKANEYAQQIETFKNEIGESPVEIVAKLKSELQEMKITATEAVVKINEYARQIEVLEAEQQNIKAQEYKLKEYAQQIESLKKEIIQGDLKIKSQAEQLEEINSQQTEIEILRLQIKELKKRNPLEDVQEDQLHLRIETDEIMLKVQEEELKRLRSQIHQIQLDKQFEELERLKKETSTIEELKKQTVLIKHLRDEIEEKEKLLDKKEESTPVSRPSDLSIEELKSQKEIVNILYEIKKDIKETIRLESTEKDAKNKEEYVERLKELRIQEQELEQLRSQTKELNFLYRFSKEISVIGGNKSGSGEPKAILLWTLEQIQSYLNCDIVSYFIARDHGIKGHIRTICQLNKEIIEETKTRMINQFITWNPRRKKETKRKVLLSIDVLQEDAPCKGKIGSFLTTPIKEEDKIIGVLNASNLVSEILPQEKAFTPLEERLFNILSDQISVALERANLFMEMQDAAERDELTGVYNFRYFDKLFEREFALANRYHQSISLIMLDFDHLKYVNDTYGHQEGNRLIKTIAHLIQKGVRNTDWVVRFGGDEFGVILPQTDLEPALVVAQRIRELIANHSIIVQQKPYQLTASLGLASYHRASEASSETVVTTKTLLSHADFALYKAKELGRNRVCLYEEALLIETTPVISVSEQPITEIVKAELTQAVSVVSEQSLEKKEKPHHEWRDIIKILFAPRRSRV